MPKVNEDDAREFIRAFIATYHTAKTAKELPFRLLIDCGVSNLILFAYQQGVRDAKAKVEL